MKKRIVITVLVGGLLSIALSITLGYGVNPWVIQHFSPPVSKPADEFQAATVIQPPQALTDFTLTDTRNQPFSQQNLLGFWTVLFFGYAECPDICPTTLAQMGELWRLLPSHQAPRFIFVSLDPDRDSVQNLQQFLNNFHPSFLGLTGNLAEMQKLAKAVRVYSWTDPQGGPKKKIDHTAALMLINPQGRLQALFTPPHDINTIARELALIMR